MVALTHAKRAHARFAAAVAANKAALHVSNSCALPLSRSFYFSPGCSALLFQTLWLRLSGLAFGNSVWSAALNLEAIKAKKVEST
jgi:hypothetical protein